MNETVTSPRRATVKQRFLDNLSETQSKVERIQMLGREIEGQSNDEQAYIKKLKDAPRSAKIAKRDLKRKLRTLHRSHLYYLFIRGHGPVYQFFCFLGILSLWISMLLFVAMVPLVAVVAIDDTVDKNEVYTDLEALPLTYVSKTGSSYSGKQSNYSKMTDGDESTFADYTPGDSEVVFKLAKTHELTKIRHLGRSYSSRSQVVSISADGNEWTEICTFHDNGTWNEQISTDGYKYIKLAGGYLNVAEFEIIALAKEEREPLSPMQQYYTGIKEDFAGWDDVAGAVFDGEGKFNKAAFDELMGHKFTLHLIPLILFCAVFSALLSFAIWHGARKSDLRGKILGNGMKTPLYTPDNKKRQKELDRIYKKLERTLPGLLRDGNSIMRQESKSGKISDKAMADMGKIERLEEAARRLTLKGHLRAARKRAWGDFDVGGALAVLGGVILACVGIAAAVAAPTEVEVTWSDGSKTREYR